MHVNMTDALVAAIKPSGKQTNVIDTVVKHLYLRISKRGKKSWYHVVSERRKTKWYMLGTFPELSVEEAREVCRRANMRLDGWKDVISVTIDDLFVMYWETRAKRLKSAKSVLNTYNKHIKDVFPGPAERVQPMRVEQWHNEIADRIGAHTANRALSIIQACCNFGIKHNKIRYSPARTTEKKYEEPRTRYLSDIEVEKFLYAVDKLKEPWGDYFRLLLFTGQRRTNVACMKWKDVNLERGIWTINGSEHKSGKLAVCVLCDEALRILNVRRANTNGCAVLPHVYNNGSPRCPMSQWAKIKDMMNVHDIRIHDLRRTLGSWQAINGVSTRIIQQTLTHRNESSTKIYSMLDNSTVRDSINGVVNKMIDGKPSEDEILF